MSATKSDAAAKPEQAPAQAAVVAPSSLPSDFYTKKDDYYQGTRPELMRYFPKGGRTALDVGCGEGMFGYQLKQEFGAEVWGVDISESSIEIARQHLDKAFFADVTTNLDLLPDNYFDVMYFNDVLEHMIDPYSLLANIASKLTDHGRVVASIPNVLYHRVLWNLLVKQDFHYEKAGVMDETHLRWFTRKSMVRMFDNAGYVDIKTAPGSRTKSYRPWAVHLFTLGLARRDIHYPQIAVCAQKGPA